METASFQLNLGVLRSQMTLQIHTYQASRLWYGRKATKDRHGILGLNGFLALTNRINVYSKQGDPYADLWMLRLEEKIDETQQELQLLADEVDQEFNSVPASFTLSENLNVQPVNLPIFAGSHLGYLAIYILAQYDEIVRKAILANHIALIFRETRDLWLQRGDKALRSLLSLATQYKPSNVTRYDFEKGTLAATEAIENFGEIPLDVLDGTRRSRFSPSLTHSSDEIDQATEDSVGNQEVESTLTVIVPAESEVEKDELTEDVSNAP